MHDCVPSCPYMWICVLDWSLFPSSQHAFLQGDGLYRLHPEVFPAGLRLINGGGGAMHFLRVKEQRPETSCVKPVSLPSVLLA